MLFGCAEGTLHLQEEQAVTAATAIHRVEHLYPDRLQWGTEIRCSNFSPYWMLTPWVRTQPCCTLGCPGAASAFSVSDFEAFIPIANAWNTCVSPQI